MTVRWCIDLDGVVIDSMPTQIAYLNERFGLNYRLEDFTTWATEEVVGPDLARWMWGPDCFANPNLQIALPPVPGSVEAIRALARYGHDIFYVTDRHSELYAVTSCWLRSHGLPGTLIFANGEPKATVAAQVGAIDYAVEDAPHHLVPLSRVVRRVFAWDAPYNHGIDGERICRVWDWNGVMLSTEGSRRTVAQAA